MELKDIEKSITKTFKKEIWGKFTSALNEYELLKQNDKIAVCISGGKDSMLLASLFKELKKHNKFNFDCEYIVMNPGYSQDVLKKIEENALKLDIPIKIFKADIFEYVTALDEGSPCYLCARMRRGHLYSIAQSLGCNKIALGHHFDDVIETTLLSVLYNGQYSTMMPKLKSTNFEGLELIRPMYKIRENDIIRWKDHNGLQFINCACKFTLECSNENDSKRYEVKTLIKKLEKINPDFIKNIFSALKNVNLNMIIGYKKDGEYHNFLNDY